MNGACGHHLYSDSGALKRTSLVDQVYRLGAHSSILLKVTRPVAGRNHLEIIINDVFFQQFYSLFYHHGMKGVKILESLAMLIFADLQSQAHTYNNLLIVGQQVVSTTAELKIPSVSKQDRGEYRCVATNTLSPTDGPPGGTESSSSASMTLSVNCKYCYYSCTYCKYCYYNYIMILT